MYRRIRVASRKNTATTIGKLILPSDPNFEVSVLTLGMFKLLCTPVSSFVMEIRATVPW